MTLTNEEILERKRQRVKEWRLNNREKVLAQKKRHRDKYKQPVKEKHIKSREELLVQKRY